MRNLGPVENEPNGGFCLVVGYDDEDSNSDTDTTEHPQAQGSAASDSLEHLQAQVDTSTAPVTSRRSSLNLQGIVSTKVTLELESEKPDERVHRSKTTSPPETVKSTSLGHQSATSKSPEGLAERKRQRAASSVDSFTPQREVRQSKDSGRLCSAISTVSSPEMAVKPSEKNITTASYTNFVPSGASACAPTGAHETNNNDAEQVVAPDNLLRHKSAEGGSSSFDSSDVPTGPKTVWSREAFAFQSTPFVRTCGAFSTRRGMQSPYSAHLLRMPFRTPPPPPPLLSTIGPSALPRGREWRELHLATHGDPLGKQTEHFFHERRHVADASKSQGQVVVSVSSDDLRDPNWMNNPAAIEAPRSRKGVGIGTVSTPVYQPQTNSVGAILEPSRRQRQKHQINWLAQVALDQAGNSSEAVANQYASRRSAQTKYGW